MKLLLFGWIILSNYAGVQAQRQKNDAGHAVQVRVFANESFSLEYMYGQFPIYLEGRSTVFIEVRAIKNTRVAIPKECHVTGYRNSGHHPSLGYKIISQHCTNRAHAYYLHVPKQSKAAVRFRFEIQQFFGLANQFLYLHCKVSTCERRDVPQSTAFRCRTLKREIQQGHCPDEREESVTTGPFVVWPEWFKRDRKSLGIANSAERVTQPVNTTRAAQVRVYANKNFTLAYGKFPLYLVSYTKVFIEVKATEYSRVAFPEDCHLSTFKNRSHGNDPAVRRQLIEESCDLQGDVHFLRTKNKAVRFRFVIQNFFGEMGQNLYLHCKITTCERKYAPQPTIFNCHTHGEYCPNKKEEEITTGPFFVWPVVSRRDRTRQEMPATTQSVAAQDIEDSAATNTKKVCLDYLPAGFVACALFILGVVIALIILHLCKHTKEKINRKTTEQEESTDANFV